MAQPQKSPSSNRNDTKTLLTTLKLTTTIGAVSLTLAGWGLLARAEALTAAQDAQSNALGIAGAATAGSKMGPSPAAGAFQATSRTIASASIAAAQQALSTPTAPVATIAPLSTPTSVPTATDAATATPDATATLAPTDTPEATATAEVTATPVVKFKLNVVQWVTTNAGDPVAVVRDNSGTLWYVWGDDVPRIEQGLDPQYQPVPVDSGTRSRHS